MLSTTIRKIAQAFRFASEERLEALKKKLREDSENMLAWKLYHELGRKFNDGISILKEELDEPSLSPEDSSWDLYGKGINHLTWMNGLEIPAVEEIDLTSNQLTTLYGLEGLKAPALEDLLLEGNLIKDLKGLSGFQAPNLKRLYLGKNQLTNANGIAEMDAPNLRILDLSRNPLKHLRELGGLNAPLLEELIINSTALTSESDLEPLLFLQSKNLEKLDLRGNTFEGRMTEMRKRLADHFPFAKIIFK